MDDEDATGSSALNIFFHASFDEHVVRGRDLDDFAALASHLHLA